VFVNDVTWAVGVTVGVGVGVGVGGVLGVVKVNEQPALETLAKLLDVTAAVTVY